MKKVFIRIWNMKIWGGIILSGLSIASVIYYGNSYFQEYNLQFTQEDMFILISIGLLFILLSILVIFLTINLHKLQNKFYRLYTQNNKIYKILYSLYDEIQDNHNEQLEVNRDTQDLIIKVCKGNEKFYEKE